MSENKEQGLRYNNGKPQWSMVSFKALVPMVRVLEFGAKKYTRDNWKKGLDRHQLLESMQRHLAALIDGEEYDQESKLHHIGHILCNAMFYSFHYVVSVEAIDTGKESKEKESFVLHQDIRTLPTEVKISKGGVTCVKLFGQQEFHYGIDYSEYVDLFLEHKLKYEVDRVKTDSSSTVYKLKI